ncbi:cytochrome c biogenesis protein [Shouchella clausii]|uniref:cytochrome c biogenesis protein n=1 Tax=Shouchella clausii TaxID=79880 RepID=UPI00280A69A7|nr:cytochrome c biogenesis protein [Shouchella clausii]WMM31283.1 cytochrome c biogenesis protein [Shouchella clausii]
MDFVYPITVLLYSLSLIGYFIDFLTNNQKANRIAFWLLLFVWGLQTVYFVMRMFELDRLPLITPFEGLFFYAWSIVTVSLFINWKVKMAFLVFVLNVLGFAVMSGSLFVPSGDVTQATMDLLASELLVMHVVFILLSYTGFTVAAAAAVLYLLAHQLLKRRLWGKRLIRLDSLPQTEKFSYFASVASFPFYLVGVIWGVVWSISQYDHVWWTDAKTIWSLSVLAAYGLYFYLRLAIVGKGYRSIWLNIGAFAVLLINYIVSGRYTDFHTWL